MKIIDLIDRIKELSRNEKDSLRLIQTIIKNKEKLHICDLDMSLILLSIGGARLMKESEIKALADSAYAKYVVPELFKEDVQAVDEKKFINEVIEAIKARLSSIELTNEAISEVLNHELYNEINVDSILVNKVNEIALNNNVQIQVRCNNFYSFALSQTRSSVINEVILSNIGENTIKDVKLKITATPDYLSIADIDISVLNPHEPISVRD